MLKNGVTLIAEVKTESPFGHKSDRTFDELFEVANFYGDIISIHTDKRWGGSFDLLEKARKLTAKPILAKGIHKTDEEIIKAISCGANFVLVVGRIPETIPKDLLMIEPLDIAELKKIPFDYKVVWNSRNLKDGNKKEESFFDARSVFGGWLCQASNIKSISDIEKGADAVLVGENLEQFIKML